MVENRPGGDAIVAITAVISAADDHVLLFAPASTFTAHPLLHEKLPYKADDLVPIARVTNTLIALGVPAEFAHYLLPNAVSVRYTESSDLLNLHHKHKMRLCYNAQEEIWRASVDEARQIRAVHPRIGRWLLPPCTIRDRAGVRPICPEGERFCGEKVWRIDIDQYERII